MTEKIYAELQIDGRKMYGRRVGGSTLYGRPVVSFTRVRKDGSDWERETADGTQTQLLICTTANVVRELFMCLHYGELLPLAECKRPLLSPEMRQAR